MKTAILFITLNLLSCNLDATSTWECDTCKERITFDAYDFQSSATWHAHTDSYSQIDESSCRPIRKIFEKEWRNKRERIEIMTSPLTAIIVIFCILLALCPIWHYRILTKKYGNSLSPAQKTAITATAFTAACIAGSAIGSKLSGHTKQ